MENINQETPYAPVPILPLNVSGNVSYGMAPVQPNQSTIQNQVPHGHGQRVGSNMDPKKLKRVAASREYSQKYRLKQLHDIAKLETKVRALQAEVAIAFPRIKYADAQNSLLRAENASMNQKLSDITGNLMFKEAEYHELKKEKDALKQMFALYQASYADISQKTNSYDQLVNMTMDQTAGFNQFMEAAEAPMMPNQNVGNQLGFDLNNGNNCGPV
ncbi:hypothetical protein DITRI_Ditri05aG0008800 [Diplodiscus trichospermus]